MQLGVRLPLNAHAGVTARALLDRMVRNERRVRWMLFLLAFCVRLIAVLYLRTYQIPPQLSEHEAIAARLVQGEGYSLRPLHGIGYLQPTSWMAPLYPYLLALTYALLGIHTSISFLAMQLLQALASALTCVLLVAVGTRVLNRRVGLVAALILCVYPALLYAVATIRPITFIILLLTTEILLFLQIAASVKDGVRRPLHESTAQGPVLEPSIDQLRRIQAKADRSDSASRRRKRTRVACGLVVGVLALLEPVTLVFAPFAALWLLFQTGGSFGQKLRSVVAIAAIALVVISPWTVRNYLVHGRLVFIKSSLGYQLWVGNNPRASGTARILADEAQQRKQIEERRDLSWPGLLQLLWLQKKESTGVLHTMPPELQAQLGEMPEIESDALLVRMGVDYVLGHPGRFRELTLQRIAYFWWLDPTNPLASSLVYVLPWAFLLLFAVVGILTSLHQWRGVLPLYLVLISMSLPYTLTVVESRFRMPLEPNVMVFTAQGLVWLGSRLIKRRSLHGAQ